MRARRPLAIAAAAGLVVLTGCAQEPTPLVVRTGGVDRAPAEKISPEDDARQRAKGVVTGYFASADGIFDNPSADPGGATLEAVAEGSAKTVASTRANRLILAERAQTSRTEISDLTITSLDLTFDDSRKITVWPTVRLSGCIDRSALKTVDASGSAVKDPALRSVRATFSVRNTSWPSRDGWRLSWFKESKTRC